MDTLGPSAIGSGSELSGHQPAASQASGRPPGSAQVAVGGRPVGCPEARRADDGDRRQVHARARDRPRRHGRGLAGARRGAGPRGRAQADRHAAGAAAPTSHGPSARRGWPPASTTRTWSRSSTWSTTTTSMAGDGVRRGRHPRRAGPRRGRRSPPTGGRPARARPPTRSPRPTRPGSCTATSSRPTCWSPRDGPVKLADFGIARAEADATLTQTGLVTGSPAYLAPEVASGQPATDASDVWSLGRHALPRARRPAAVRRRADNVMGTLYRIVHEDPPRLAERRLAGAAARGDV